MWRAAFSKAAIAALLFLLASTGVAGASTFTVNRTDDPGGIGPCAGLPGDCSLRQAITNANLGSGNNVVIPAGAYSLSAGPAGDDLNASGDLDVLSSMTISGAGAGVTTIAPTGRYDRAFDFGPGSTGNWTLSGVTVTGGGGVTDGAGIAQEQGALTINDSAIVDNVISAGLSGGGGIYFKTGTLAINRTSVSNNKVDDSEGAGIYTSAPADLTVRDSTISGNSGQAGAEGGGFYIQDKLSMVNSTVSGNVVEDGGGLLLANAGGPVSITSSTIAGNATAADGGGIYSDATLSIENSIVAGNSGPPGKNNCANFLVGKIVSNGHNLEDGATCGFAAAGDLPSTNPLLDPLAANGGGTPTMALRAGSPAIHAGNAASCPATDQRGVARTGGCDIGAFQYVDSIAPVISKLKLKPKTFGTKKTKVSFTLSEAASVKFTVERVTSGHKKNHKCKSGSRGGPRCKRVKTLKGSFTKIGAAGANSFSFNGRLNKKRLPTGNYRLVAVATDAAGNKGAKVRASFRVKR